MRHTIIVIAIFCGAAPYLQGDIGKEWRSLRRKGSLKKVMGPAVIRIPRPLVKELDLSGLYIDSLDGLDLLARSHPNLQVLALQNNSIAEVPPAIGSFTKLKKLILAGNNITHLPKEIGNLVNLEVLDLSKNSSLATLPASMQNLTKLKQVNLSAAGGRDEKSVAQFQQNIPKGVEVNTGSSVVGYYPVQTRVEGLLFERGEGLGDVALRKWLSVRKRLLRGSAVSLKTALGKVWQLLRPSDTIYEFDLSGFNLNNLDGLELVAQKYPNLKSLILSDNAIEVLPDSIGRFKKLQNLDLRNNKIKEFPQSIGQLSNLASLSLGDNNLKSLPDSITRLHSLEHLGVEHNDLRALPQSIGQLKKLWQLNLRDNKNLTSLPDSIYELPVLQYIWDEGTGLSQLIEKNLSKFPKGFEHDSLEED